MRIIRAAKELGCGTVQVYCKADRDMLAVRLANEAVEIGRPQPFEILPNVEAVLRAHVATRTLSRVVVFGHHKHFLIM